MDHTTHQLILQTIIFALAGGVSVMVLSHRLHISSIALLLVAGIVLGPVGLGMVQPQALGHGLDVFVSLAVAIILFEGGLGLDYSGYRNAGTAIRLLLSAGVLITWLVISGGVYILFKFPIRFCLLAGSLVVVTGPTVISPLLRRLKLTKRLHHILHWESVLVDPIGVFLAILCYKLIGAQGDTLPAILLQTGLRVIVGISVGTLFGFGLYQLINRKIITDEQTNSATLGGAVLAFGIADMLIAESGLLAVVVAGFILGLYRPGELKKIKLFEEEITGILIGMLFILLAANLNPQKIVRFGFPGIVLVSIVMFIARPLSVAVSTIGSGLALREKLFLSWLAPRGIIAASMATLFAVRLNAMGNEHAWFIETFTFSVIIATVVIQGMSAKYAANVLKVHRPDPQGWIIVGIHALSEQLARFLTERHIEYVIIDSNRKNCAEATERGYTVIEGDAMDIELYDNEQFVSMGNLVALTDNDALNAMICRTWSSVLGSQRIFRWAPRAAHKETKKKELDGIGIWQFLPRPSIVSGDIIRGDARFIFGSVRERDRHKNKHPLALFKADGNISFTLPKNCTASGNDAVLYLIRETTFIHRITNPRMICTSNASSMSEVLKELLKTINTTFPMVPKDYIFNELVEREKGFSTAIGEGVAVPHTYCPDLSSPVCAITRLATPLDWNAIDGTPVDLIFLLISPPGDPEKHLALLSLIAQLTIDPEVLQALKKAATSKELYQVIQSKEIALYY